MIDIKRLSSYYEIRTLTDSDVDDILDLCQHNTLFYEYTEARPTREEIQRWILLCEIKSEVSWLWEDCH